MQTTDTFYSSSPAPMTARRTRVRSGTFSRSNVLVALGLVITMLVGGYFRFVGLNWDDFTHLHPDERFITDVTQGLGNRLAPSDNGTDDWTPETQVAECVARYPATGGMGGYFDALCSPYNPHNANPGHGMYVYGTLPLFMTLSVAEVVAPASEWWARNISVQSDPTLATYDGRQWLGYDGVHLIFRYLSALAEMSVIVVVFCIGLRLHNKWVGLLGAWLYAGIVFSIQLSHFGTTDAISDMFCAVTILFAVCIQRQGKLRDYILFGVFFGFALASRINLAPLVGLILLAAIMRVLPTFDRHSIAGDRERAITQAFLGLVLAGIVTILVFRVTNPYAFMGPGFFGLTPNPRFLYDLATAQQLVSGSIDSPPNFQWGGRTPYLFPWWNMVMWGMGLPLGLTAWAAFIWAFYRLIRGKRGATLNILLLAWVTFYFAFMGRNWVMTMRYFIPLYASLAVLAAWGMHELFIIAREKALLRRARGLVLRRGFAWGVLIVVAGFTTLWAAMYTNVYRNLLTRVQAGHWVWENTPGDFAMEIDTGDGRSDQMVSLNDGQYQTRAVPLTSVAIPSFNRFNSDDNDLVAKSTRWDESIPTSSDRFVASETGTIRSFYAPHLGDPNDDPENEVLSIVVRRYADNAVVATATIDQNLTRDTHITGDRVEVAFDAPFEVTQGEEFFFDVELISGGPVISGGTIFTWEGAWDDPVPLKVCSLPDGITLADSPPPGTVGDSRNCNSRDPWWGLVIGYQQDIVYEDGPEKLAALYRSLDNSDYIAISSNRFYDTLNRNPLRWPLTGVYYDALFSGRLGWELVATFQESYELGPLRVSDQYLPTYNGYYGGDLFNEYESEEAFSVYDHPVVFIFQRSENYDPEVVRDILGTVPYTRVYDANPYNQCPEDLGLYFCNTQIVNVATVPTEDAALAPTALMLTPQAREIQENGGTWSERFDSDSPVNTSIPVTIAAWYGVLFLFGAAVFPALYVLLPALADRGYGFSKFIGMFLVAFGTWYLASVRAPVWSQAGVIGGMVIMALVSLALVWRHRGDYLRWVRAHWKRLLAIETITFIMFMVFVGYRLINPDLWHDSFGGEKPMDFGYFNGVLRSTIFPAIDPWYSGGFINYYYFGFVIVGTPVLLLKMLPSIAYNLILPTLFAVTAIGAFSVAFSIVDALKDRLSDGTWKRRANKWLAGIAAMLLCVVLGNLDTPRVMLTGLANAGGYDQPQDLQTFLMDEYTRENGTIGDEATMLALTERAEANNLGDRLRFEAWVIQEQVTSVFSGLQRLLSGDQIYISPDRWFWAPSRVYMETPGVGSAITEMPAFTFIYADLHAHMISMPLQLFVFAFVLNEVLNAGNDSRRRGQRWLALAIGAIVVGMLRATNTWDWITYMLLGVLGLGFAWWLKWRVLSRDSLVDMVMRVGGFIVISALAVLPFTTWYASTYNSIRPWTDGKSPLWAFFIIHGLFIFLVVSLLAWDTSRWLQESRVKSLRGSCLVLLIGAAAAVLVFTGALVLAALDWQVTLVALPMLVWVGVLFFRANQTRPMQFMLALAGLALGLILGVEYIVLDGDIGRQNTVFKFYMQVWLMFSVIGGVAVALLWRSSSEWRAAPRTAWTAVLVVLVTIASLFPIMAARGRTVYRMQPVTTAEGTQAQPPFTLDGMMYMTWAQRWEGDNDNLALDPTLAPFPLSGDYAMIRWLQENVQGSPVIIEGLGEDTQYQWNARISINTGLPAVVGWNFHQRQQRTLDPMGRMVEMRNANVNGFYETGDLPSAWAILQHYRVQYIILGRYERAHYGQLGLAKFDRMEQLGLIERVFDADGSIIYVVNQDAPFDPAQLDVG
ncbi:MAG: glycosyltransferase family 39 protein [Pleurocapsa minor GSE-CHR-MK-17-07R]|jgi:YYY domain-containing protein|nr:glycosyltransferase family 39 protein [Pleurocapsa minor GSE-CHR-MK 17-07R]